MNLPEPKYISNWVATFGATIINEVKIWRKFELKTKHPKRYRWYSGLNGWMLCQFWFYQIILCATAHTHTHISINVLPLCGVYTNFLNGNKNNDSNHSNNGNTIIKAIEIMLFVFQYRCILYYSVTALIWFS